MERVSSPAIAWRRLTGLATVVLCQALLCQAIGGTALASTLTHISDHPEIQMWSYPAASSIGAGAVRDRAATFATYSYVDSTTGEAAFYQGSGLDPSRRATFMIATDTTTSIPAGLDPSRYRIDSLRVTTTLLGSQLYTGQGQLRPVPYDHTLDTAEELTTIADSDPGRPMEMYGVGLQGDFETIGFSDTPAAGEFTLGAPRWRQWREGEPNYDPSRPASQQSFTPYQYFAIDADGRDAENSVFGGYSATEPDHRAPQFTPTPFAIGQGLDSAGNVLAPGTLLEHGYQFVFEPDLTNLGILAYLQQSLAAGHLAFSFSSMHEPAGHTGAVPYPDFYMDDWDVGINPDGSAPTIELMVTLLSTLPGDYDGNGTVGIEDYTRWKELFGTDDSQADGNGNGVVDAADYTIWRNHFVSQGGLAGSVTTTTVPEPDSALIGGFLTLVAFCFWVDRYARRDPRGEDRCHEQ